MAEVQIHPTAIVSPEVKFLGKARVGAYSILDGKIEVAHDVSIAEHVLLKGTVSLGENVQLESQVIVGAIAQILDDSGAGEVIVGKNTVIREGTQVHRGSSRGNGKTIIGENVFLMSQCHVGHDSIIEDEVIVATMTGLAGHSTIHQHALISGACGIGQHVRVGAYSFSAGMTRIRKDVPPFMSVKEEGRVTSPNLVGLKRKGFSEEDLRMVKNIYKKCFLRGKSLKEGLALLNETYQENGHFQYFKNFVESSQAGLMRGASS